MTLMTSEVSVTLDDGASTQLRLQVAAEPSPVAVLVLPAMGTAAAYYDPLVAELAGRGVTAAVMDLRGIGASSVRAGRGRDFGYDTLVSDALCAARALAERAPGAREVVFLGHSLGGQVAMLALARGAGPVSRVALVAAGSPFHRAYPRPLGDLGVLSFSWVARAASEAFGYFPGKRFGFGGREARTIMREWSRLVRHGSFKLDAWSGSEAPESALRRARARILAVEVKGDSFTPKASIDALVAKVPAMNVERATVPGRGRNGRATHHAWARKPADVAAHVVAWLRDEATQPVSQMRGAEAPSTS
jgi:predicted alpha/beta hydrolase